MKIYTDIIKLNAINPVVTIGVFDGVHTGHRQILQKVSEEAKRINGESVIITFWPHPRLIVDSKSDRISLLTTIEEKQLLLERYGINHLIIIPFTKSFSELSAKQFIKRYLVKKIKTHTIFIGYNHQFGKNREGGFETLEKYGSKYHFTIHQIDAHIIENERVSSTIIRNSLVAGLLSQANKYLGYDYFMIGKITYGHKIGTRIGFPTANIEFDENFKLIPRDGVYAVLVIHNREIYKGMMNIGFRPTIHPNSKKRIPEVHIFDFEKDIYLEKIIVIFVAFLREEIKFNSTEELKQQLHSDMVKSKELITPEIIMNNNYLIK